MFWPKTGIVFFSTFYSTPNWLDINIYSHTYIVCNKIIVRSICYYKSTNQNQYSCCKSQTLAIFHWPPWHFRFLTLVTLSDSKPSSLILKTLCFRQCSLLPSPQVYRGCVRGLSGHFISSSSDSGVDYSVPRNCQWVLAISQLDCFWMSRLYLNSRIPK